MSNRPTIFETFTIGGRRYLAVYRSNPVGYSIISDTGENYGTWMMLDGAKAKLREREAVPIGNVGLSIQVLEGSL